MVSLSYLVIIMSEHGNIDRCLSRVAIKDRILFIYYETTLLPRYYTVLSKEILSSTTSIGSPGTTLLVRMHSQMPFATRSIGARSHVHKVRLYYQAGNAWTLGPLDYVPSIVLFLARLQAVSRAKPR